MIRYCFSRILLLPDPNVGQAWKAAITKHSSNVKAARWPVNADNTPQVGWTVCSFSTHDLSGAIADPDIKLMPQATPDAKIGTIGTVVKSRLIADLAAAGFDASAVQNADTFRDLINAVGQSIQPAFDHDRHFVINDP